MFVAVVVVVYVVVRVGHAVVGVLVRVLGLARMTVSVVIVVVSMLVRMGGAVVRVRMIMFAHDSLPSCLMMRW